MYRSTAAQEAKSLLAQASRGMSTPDPAALPAMSRALDEGLDWSLEDRRRAAPRGPFSPHFSETEARSLAFRVVPGDRSFSAADRVAMTTRSMQDVISSAIGDDAAYWFDARTEPLRSAGGEHVTGFGAEFSTNVDSDGLREASATYGWSPTMTSHFPASIVDMVRRATETMPGLQPFSTTIRTGRLTGGQQVTFDIGRTFDFSELKTLMEAFGLGSRLGSLTTLGAFVLGARFKIPAHTATLTLLRSGRDVEMRLDINLDALGDAPPLLLPLLRLPMAERPQQLQAFDRWLTALTPDGYHGPGSVNILSIRVRPDMAARLAVFLRPVFLGDDEEDTDDQGSVVPPGEFSADEMPLWRPH